MRIWGSNPSQWDSAVSVPRELKATTPQKNKVIENSSKTKNTVNYTEYPKFANESRPKQEIKVLNHHSSGHRVRPRRSEKLKKEVPAMGLIEVEILVTMSLLVVITRRIQTT